MEMALSVDGLQELTEEEWVHVDGGNVIVDFFKDAATAVFDAGYYIGYKIGYAFGF